MSKLGRVVEAVEKYNAFVEDEVKRARTDQKFGAEMVKRWNEIKAKIPVGTAPTGLKLPRLALPEIDEAGDITHDPSPHVCRTCCTESEQHVLQTAFS